MDEWAADLDESVVKDEAAFDEEATGTLFSSVITLANSAIGAGVLAFPYAFKNAGVGMALAMTTGLVIIMCFCILIISRSCERHAHCKTYNTLVRHYFGSRVGQGFEVVLILYLFGSCIGYMIIVYDMIQPVVEKIYCGNGCGNTEKDDFYNLVVKNDTASSRAILIGVFSFTIMLPLSLLRKVTLLHILT